MGFCQVCPQPSRPDIAYRWFIDAVSFRGAPTGCLAADDAQSLLRIKFRPAVFRADRVALPFDAAFNVVELVTS